MTREIKFRAWDMQVGIVLEVVNVKDGFKQLGDKQITTSQLFDEAEENKYIPMQYTGLKDRNGKEIYEGDLCNDGSQVQFVGGRWILFYNGGDYEDLIGEQDEVIGNIYENPELIK